MSLLLPQVYGHAGQEPARERLAEALSPQPKPGAEAEDRRAASSRSTPVHVSASEVLQHADFETMTGAELAQAKKLIARLRLPDPRSADAPLSPPIPRRRIDLPATLRASMKGGARSSR